MKRLVVDVDGTISHAENGDYVNASPDTDLINRLREYSEAGYEIVVATSRNMRSYQGNVGKINANTLPVLIDWLNRHNVPYDEIWTGKPWCGFDGFYVDDKAVRPDEFKAMSLEKIKQLTGNER